MLTSHLTFQAIARTSQLQPGLSARTGRRHTTELVKTATGTSCVLGWFCAGGNALPAPLTG